jgi:hypothetical protein
MIEESRASGAARRELEKQEGHARRGDTRRLERSACPSRGMNCDILRHGQRRVCATPLHPEIEQTAKVIVVKGHLHTIHQFVVFEAKVFSGLSTKMKNASKYDQAAGTVGCMAEVLTKTGWATD